MSFDLLLLLPLAASLITAPQGPSLEEKADARKGIEAAYRIWSKARTDYDRTTLEKSVTPDFYVQIGKERLSKQLFLDQVLQKSNTSRLTRFETDVMTVQKVGDVWVAVITEKLETELTGPDGKKFKIASFWITRDGWKKEGDRYLATYSEAIGWERWGAGETPPIKGWKGF